VTDTIRQLTKKVCMLGDFAVGKTSLVRQFIEGRFDEKYLSTIGVKVDRKVLYLPREGGNVELTLMLWDLAGGPRRGPVVPSYYHGSAGAILVCDLTRPETLDGIDHYIQSFLAANPAAKLVMVANKADLVTERLLSDEDLAEAASAHACPAFVTSAKTGEQVEEMFRTLGALLVTE
jgi:small GTP-binding protein